MTDNKKENHHAISNMERGAGTYRVRNKRYGNNYKRFGEIMMALFPNGLTINSVEHWNRMGVIHMIIAKMSRYVTDPKKGHLDSAHDMGVYSFMLEELDAEAEGFDVSPPLPLVTTVQEVGPKATVCEHVYEYPCAKEHFARRCKKVVPNTIHSCGKPTCVNCGDRRES
jgi:hypothetical protein